VRRRGAFRFLVAIAAMLALTLATLLVLVATGTMRGYVISTSAMEPTLHCASPAPGCEASRSDRVLALTRLVSFERGDLVVFPAPPRGRAECGVGGNYVKRVVALPGETVETRLLDGVSHVYVDGKRLAEPYVDDDRRDSARVERFTVPPGHLFVLGDNRAAACDSRHFGTVPEEDVIGELVVTWWPLDRLAIR
jgi:signal peptidase I